MLCVQLAEYCGTAQTIGYLFHSWCLVVVHSIYASVVVRSLYASVVVHSLCNGNITSVSMMKICFVHSLATILSRGVRISIGPEQLHILSRCYTPS